MNKKTTIALLLMLAAQTVQAQKIVVTDKEVNCGKVEYFKPATATFKMKNRGEGQLRMYRS